jgi:ABC-type hemin transport system ATPase subunit
MILVIIVLAVAGALAGTVLGELLDKIRRELKSKRLAVLGARGVGETTLIKFLTSGFLPVECKQTIAPEKIASHR